MKILIYNEGEHDKTPEIKKVYKNGIHGALKEALAEHDVTIVTLDNVGDITEQLLNDTDVTLWWGHMRHAEVPDEVAARVQNAVLRGMGFIALHSAHMSKPFRLLMGTSCTLRWRENSRERIWVTSPSHPIANGLPEQFELPAEEMYGEFFDVPEPMETVFIGWYNSGEVFRSGLTYRRGLGKIFYFQPGHESYPTFYNENIIKVLNNAVLWAAPERRIDSIPCPCTPPLEKI